MTFSRPWPGICHEAKQKKNEKCKAKFPGYFTGGNTPPPHHFLRVVFKSLSSLRVLKRSLETEFWEGVLLGSLGSLRSLVFTNCNLSKARDLVI